MDIASLLSVSGTSLYGTSSSSTKSSSGTDFTSYLLDAFSNKSTTKKEANPLYTALTSATNTDLYAGSSSSYLDYLSNYTGSSSSIEGYLSNYSTDNTSSDKIGNSLMTSFQSQMLHTLTAAKEKLETNATAYAAKVGEAPSTATKYRLEQMQQNVSILDQFLTQKKSENGLMDALGSNSSLSQYLINKNNSSLL